MGLAGVVGGRVGDTEATTEVDLGKLHAVLVADVLQQPDDPVGGDLEAGHVEDLRPDVGVDADELEAVQLKSPSYGFGGLATGQRDAELLVLVGGGDELVRMCFHADGDTDLDALPLAEFLGDVGDADDLLEGVEDDTADVCADRPFDLVLGLVVAVEGDAVGGHTGGERGGELATGTDVEVEPLLVQPADDCAGEEGLAGVEDVGVGTEGGTPGAGPRTEVGLVDDVGGSAVLLGELRGGDAADGEDTVLVARDRLGPDLRVEGVEVGGRRGVVALGEDVGVTGPGGVCGTAHGLWLAL